MEVMGKHSNLIFCTEDGTIIDSIKHISAQVSSVREVLPGRTYFIPDTQSKSDPLTVNCDAFIQTLREKPTVLSKAIYTSFTGISRSPRKRSVFSPVWILLCRPVNTLKMC